MVAPHYVASAIRCSNPCSGAPEDCAYRVAWQINPHMRVGHVQTARAARQHAELLRVLEDAGARVSVLPFVHGAFDSVFAKDNALLTDRDGPRALLGRPRHAERRAEQRARFAALVDLGIDVVAVSRWPLEGGDVVAHPGGFLVGTGFRTDTRARDDIERFFGIDVDAVALVDPRLYHLDMALAVTSDGTAFVCREAFASIAPIERAPGIDRMVPVPLEEALAFGLNVVQVGRHVVMGGHSPTVVDELTRRGHVVHRVDLREFHLAGGSAACLVSRVYPDVLADRDVPSAA